MMEPVPLRGAFFEEFFDQSLVRARVLYQQDMDGMTIGERQWFTDSGFRT
jgi:hypothetical protein